MKFKVGVIGLRRGLSFVDVFRLMPDAEVTAVCDASEERLAWFDEKRGGAKLLTRFEDLLNADVDIIVVASPAPQHAAHSIAALEAGKHVISEVPAVWSLEEAEQLLNAVRRSKAQYSFAENCCYWHFVEVWRDWVAEGKLGKVIYAEAEYVHDCRRIMRDANGLTWRASMPPIYYCTHSLGPLLKIMGGRFVSAVGMGTGVNVAPELGAIDMEVGLFQHDSGAVVKLLCGFSVEREPAHHYFVLYGTHGSVEKSRFDNRTMAHLPFVVRHDAQQSAVEDRTPLRSVRNYEQGHDAQQSAVEDRTPLRSVRDYEQGEFLRMATTPFTTDHPAPPEGATAGGHGTCEYFMLRDFLDALRDDLKLPIDIVRGLAMTLPGICAHLSAEQGGQMMGIPDLR